MPLSSLNATVVCHIAVSENPLEKGCYIAFERCY